MLLEEYIIDRLESPQLNVRMRIIHANKQYKLHLLYKNYNRFVYKNF